MKQKKVLMRLAMVGMVLSWLFAAEPVCASEEVEVSITPERLKLSGNQGGSWVTCQITLPEDCDPEEVGRNDVLLEGKISPFRVGVCTDPENPFLITANFVKEDVIALLKETGQTGDVELTVTVELEDGTVLEGSDVIKVSK